MPPSRGYMDLDTHQIHEGKVQTDSQRDLLKCSTLCITSGSFTSAMEEVRGIIMSMTRKIQFPSNLVA